MKKHAAPIIAAILLLLPVLYVGSFLAMVMPKGVTTRRSWPLRGGSLHIKIDLEYYRFGGDSAARFYWPLERIDRKVRPRAWEPSAQLPSPHRATIGKDGLERIGVDFE